MSYHPSGVCRSGEHGLSQDPSDINISRSAFLQRHPTVELLIFSYLQGRLIIYFSFMVSRERKEVDPFRFQLIRAI